jgi:multidrug resistance protein
MTTEQSLDPGAIEGMDVKKGGLGSRAQKVALATLCAVLFLTFLDNTVVSVGLANVQSGLHAGVASLQWVVNGYALTFAGLMLAGGTLGDLLGRKRVMLGGVAVFCAGSVVAALAPNVDLLIVGRVIMGIGAAASEPGTLSIIRHVYPDKGTRADALGVWAAVSGLALALGPVIGGVLVGLSSWRAIFWFNLAIGAVAFAMTLVFVPETSDRQGNRVDVGGDRAGGAHPGRGVVRRDPGRAVGLLHLVDPGPLRRLGGVGARLRHGGAAGAARGA